MYNFLTSIELYNFLKGPMVWIAFLVFFGGSIYRVISLTMLAKKDKVVYPYLSLKYSLRSFAHWLFPFGSRNMRLHPWMTFFAFTFHIGLLVTPIVLYPHVVLWYKAWGVRWWSLPENVADIMTLIFILCCIFFIFRRMFASEVRFVTYAADYFIIAIAAAPFITGFLAFHQIVFPYRLMLIFHIIFGELMLMLIPFTRLSHMLFFWLTRAHTGSEFGVFRHSKDY
jgi:nitrate reductase gamma subunit